jgi:hypothetical protein
MAALPPPLVPVGFDPKFEANAPRYLVQVNGLTYLCDSYEIEYNGHGATDKVTAVLPIKGNPDWTQALDGFGASPIYIKVFAGFPSTGAPIGSPASLKQRFWGIIDSYVLKPGPDDDTVTFACRSLAAPLISRKVTTPFTTSEAQTTVDFIQQMAAQFGLGVKINIIGTGGKMVDVLASEFQTGVTNWVIWNLMIQCAQYDDADIWVDQAGILHYEAPSLIDRTTIPLKWGRDIAELSGSHATQFSKNIRVEVRSYTKRTKFTTVTRVESLGPQGGIKVMQTSKTVTSSPVFGTLLNVTKTIAANGNVIVSESTGNGGGAQSSGGGTAPISETGQERYVFYVKNKTSQQCDDQAQQIWRQISMHEFGISLVVPVTEELLEVMDITAEIDLQNTPFAKLNDLFWPRRITEIANTTAGWYWDIDAVNHQLPQGAV